MVRHQLTFALSLGGNFFVMRDERNRRLARHESPNKRRTREQREQNPPIVGAKVFTWEVDKSGHLVRELVDLRDRVETLAPYSSDQIRYDAFANEYDCCREFGGKDGYSPTDHSECEEGEEPFTTEVAVGDIHVDVPISYRGRH